MKECAQCGSREVNTAVRCSSCGAEFEPVALESESSPLDVEPIGLPSAVQALVVAYRRQLDSVMAAELNHKNAMLTGFMRHGGKMTRRTKRQLNDAFAALANAVVELQRINHVLHYACVDHGVTWEQVCAEQEDVAWADTAYDDYLAAESDLELLSALEKRGM